MIKGYIFKDDGMWQLGFLSDIGSDGESLYTVHGIYSTWGLAVAELIKTQIRGQ